LLLGNALMKRAGASTSETDLVESRFSPPQSDQIQEIIYHFQCVLRISPKTVGALDRLAWISSTYPEGWRNGARAVEWAEQACSLTSYASPELLGTLAVAYAEVGRFGDALRMVHKAQLLARQSERTGLEELHAEWLRLFET